MTTVTLSEHGLQMIALDGEYAQNAATIRRLTADKRDIEDRLQVLRRRQDAIVELKGRVRQAIAPDSVESTLQLAYRLSQMPHMRA